MRNAPKLIRARNLLVEKTAFVREGDRSEGRPWEYALTFHLGRRRVYVGVTANTKADAQKVLARMGLACS